MGYENITFTASKSEESQAMTNPVEPDYEMVTVISSQPASATTQITSSSGEEDGYNELNRDAVHQKWYTSSELFQVNKGT